MDTGTACKVSSKRVPKHGAYERLVSAAALAIQDFRILVNRVLEDYAREGVYAVLGHYYSTMLLLNIPRLFSTTLQHSQTSREHALNAVRMAALAASRGGPSYKDARMATSLIHSLLEPSQPDMSPTTEDFVHLGDDDFRAGIQALLLKSCSEPFYESAPDDLLGPDEIVSDILLWLGGPSFEFPDAQWRKTCMPVWIYIAKRALVPQYLSRPDWQDPSDYLQRNLRRLTACSRLFGILGAAIADGAAGGGDHHAERLDADREDVDAEFWNSDDVRCVAVVVVELVLRHWYDLHSTNVDPPYLVVDRTARALARLHSKHVEEVREHLLELTDHIRYFHDDSPMPTMLFKWKERKDQNVKKAAAECVFTLTVLKAMLTPLPEGSP